MYNVSEVKLLIFFKPLFLNVFNYAAKMLYAKQQKKIATFIFQ